MLYFTEEADLCDDISKKKRKKKLATESNPTYEMFGLDRDALLEKIMTAKDDGFIAEDDRIISIAPDIPSQKMHKSRKHFKWDDYLEK